MPLTCRHRHINAQTRMVIRPHMASFANGWDGYADAFVTRKRSTTRHVAGKPEYYPHALRHGAAVDVRPRGGKKRLSWLPRDSAGSRSGC